MRVNCENCNTNFNLDEGLVKNTGSKVRCSKCKHIFVVYPPQPAADEPAIEEQLTDADEELGGGVQAPAGDVEAADREKHDAGADEDTGAPQLDEAPAEETEGEDLDLSDIERMLEAEGQPDVPAEEPEESLPQEGAGGDEASLDLSDIEKILEEQDESDELLEEKSDEDLVFDLDEGFEMEAGEEQISPATELDLGDLEKMFGPEEELETSEDEEPAVSLGPETEEEDLSLIPETDVSDLSEELSLETDAANAAEPAEIAGMFGFDMETADDEDTTERLYDIKAEDITLEEEPDTPGADADELDLEATIEIDSDTPESETEELDIEATISMDSEEIASETDELDLEETIKIDTDTQVLDFSLQDVNGISDLEDGEIEAKESPGDEIEIVLEGDADEFEDVGGISEETLEIEVAEDELTDLEEEMEMEFPDDAVPDIPDEEMAFEGEEPDLEEYEDLGDGFEEIGVEETSGGGLKKLFGLLAVVLVVILLLAAFLFLQNRGVIHMPYLDKVIGKQKSARVTDFGNLNITYTVDNYRFLETDKAGKVFIITGKVKNGYTMPRSFIQMSGSLYAKGKIKADTAAAYCGNVISDLELSQMTPAAIRTRLGNRPGENDSNVNVKPGEERPFMIVFFNLPESLDEFTVAVAGSSEGDK